MSGRLVSIVFDSALPAWLKPYAAACASFAAEDGTRVYPTIARVAKMVGRCERATHTAVAELRRRGVLEQLAPSGRAKATRYKFSEAALAFAGNGAQLPLLLAFSTNTQRNQGKRSGKTRFPQFPQQLTCSPLQGMGAVDCTRSVIDPSVSTRTARARAKGKYPKTGTA